MNHAYRLVWNHAAHRCVPAPETAKGRGKSAGRGAVVVALCAAVSGAGAWAAPGGGSISAGSGSITQNGGTTTIVQGSQNLSINWARFGIAAGESVNFIQPGSSAIALNRVTGTEASAIHGSLTANGQVWILNPNGVLFGNGASVNVGGLVASTLSLSDADFMAGKRSFSGDGTQGAVVNQGHLTGGYVALLGNTGTITTANGTAALAAGDRVSLDFSGNRLLSVQVDEGTLNALAENKGLIRADNGTVILSASAKNALLDTVVNNEGVIEAKGIDSSGGAILLLGGMNGGTVKVAGSLDASAAGSRNGGFVDTSGAHVQVAEGARVSTRSDSGKTGTWLIDPTDFTVSAGSAGGTASGIGAVTLASNLANNSVTLRTSNGAGSDPGDINVNAAVSWSANTVLTLEAWRNININAPITATGATAGLVLNFGNYGSTGSVASGTDYQLAAPVTLSGANASLAINGNAYRLIHSMADLLAINSQGLGGRYALAQDLDAAGTTYGDALVAAGGNAFGGTFAGLYHTISNLKIVSTSGAVGLFGTTDAGSMVRDIGLAGGSLSAGGTTGGLVGRNGGSIFNAYNTGSVSGASDSVGGLVGENSSTGSIRNAYATGRVSGGARYVGGLVGRSYGAIDSAYATGDVSGDRGIGGLAGGGDGHIDNAYATGAVSGNNYLGGLVGITTSGANLSNVRAGGQVTGTASLIGGLVGQSAGTITNAYATGLVTGTGGIGNNVGGLVGQNRAGATIRNAYATGNVRGAGYSYVGGLVGSNLGTIDSVYAKGNVEGQQRVGGLVGQNQAASISNAYATGTVTGTSYAIGGLVGTNTSGGTITSAFATGNVSSPGDSVGGLVGENTGGSIDTVYATGSVSGGGEGTGGLVGKNQDSVSNAYASGQVTGPSATGGLVGWNLGGSTSNSYWNTETTGQGGSGGGTGLTSAQMMQAGSFAGWDMATTGGSSAVWRIYEGSTAPMLRAFMTGLTVSADSATKTYDGTTAFGSGSGYATSDPGANRGLILGMVAYGNSSSKNVGSYSIGIGGLYSSQLGYDLSFAAGTATITAATLTVNGTTAGNKTYDGTTAATVGGGSLGGLVAGDNVTLSQSGTFSDKNAGTGKFVNVANSLSGSDAGNYIVLAGLTPTTADIRAATLTVNGTTAADKTYDGTTGAVLSGGSLGGVVGGDTVTLSQSGSFGDKNAGTGKTVNYASSIAGGDAGNYVLAFSSGTTTANIGAATLTVNGTTAANKTYDGTTGAVLAGGTLGGLIAGDTVTLSQSGSFGDKNAGTGKTVNYASSIAGGDAGNYVLALNSGTTTADIARAALSVNGTTASNKTYDGTTAATLSGGILGGVIGGDTVTLSQSGAFGNKNAGAGKTVTIANSLGGSDGGNYFVVAGSTTADIGAATLTVSGTTAANKTYDGTRGATLSGGALGGVIAGDTVVLNQSGSFGDKNAGTGKTVNYASSLSGGDAGNYVLASGSGTTTADIARATLSVNGTTAANKTYDGTTAATLSGASLGGLIAGDTVTLSQSGSFGDKNAATGKTVSYASSIAGSDAGNYLLASSSGTTTADIARATLSVNGTTALDKTYDGTTAATLSGGALGGVIAGDTVTLSQSGTFGDKNAGTGKTVNYGSSITGSDAGNYVLASNSGTTTADIARATLSVNGTTAANKTYDGTTAATLSGGALGGVIAGDTVALNQSGSFGDKNAGTGKTVNYANSLSGGDAGNYVLASGNGTTTANINAATLTVNGTTAANKTYDGNTSATLSGASLGGLIAGDSVVLGQSGTFSDKNAATGKTVSYASSITGGDAGNYVLASSSGTTTADIARATLSVSGTTAANKTYDGTTSATVNGGTLGGVIAGDTVTLSQSGSFGDKNAGTGKAVNYASSIAGSDAGNYVLASGSGATTADIAAAKLIVSGTTAANKVYDGTTSAALSGGALGGVIAGDTVALNQSGSFGDKNAGTGKTVSYASSLSGTDAGNYVLASGSGTTTADIARATLSVNGTTAANKTYDGTTATTLSGGALNGLIAGDSVVLSQSGAFSDKNAGAGKTVSYASSITGGDAGNYVLASGSGTTTADIARATLSVNGTTAANKTYDGTTTATLNGGTLNGLIAGDSVALQQSGAFGDRNAGTGKTVNYASSLSGSDAGNYVLASNSGTTTADIGRAALTVTANDDSKTADGRAYSGGNGVHYSGFVAGESSGVLTGSLLYGGTAQGAMGAGSYGIAVSGLGADNYVLSFADGTLLVRAAPVVPVAPAVPVTPVTTTDPLLRVVQQRLQADPPASEFQPPERAASSSQTAVLNVQDCGMRLAPGQTCN
ncbi:YDG domain-containing protein [Variovorax sp. GB1P17]|uniref:YDG domain-containing protein n=1 Tax=Variovorax sp. GB1P17 TaxID=3443740 RepID=UPI003F453555